MLVYKIEDAKESIYNIDDFNYMLELVMENYKNYFKASAYLQSRYDFSLQAIYSCLSEVNNKESRLEAYRELARFLDEVKKRAGFDMQIIKGEKLFVKEKPKVKMRGFKRKFAA